MLLDLHTTCLLSSHLFLSLSRRKISLNEKKASAEWIIHRTWRRRREAMLTMKVINAILILLKLYEWESQVRSHMYVLCSINLLIQNNQLIHFGVFSLSLTLLAKLLHCKLVAFSFFFITSFAFLGKWTLFIH